MARTLSSLPGLLKNFSRAANIAKSALYIGALLSILCALLHPAWGMQEEVVEHEGRDVYIALDISRSMCAQDVAPDRLACAKRVILKLIAAPETDRAALILFAQQARVHCPLTSDMGLLHAFVQQIDCSMASTGATNLAAPIELVVERCRRDRRSTSRVLVLITDGEDFGGKVAAAGEHARACGLTIVLMGIGTSIGAPIPTLDAHGIRTGYLKDSQHRVVISRLNQSVIESLARTTGGVSCTISGPDIDVQNLVTRISALERSRQGLTQATTKIDRSYLCSACTFLCLILEWIL